MTEAQLIHNAWTMWDKPVSDWVRVTVHNGPLRMLKLPDSPQEWPCPPVWSDTGRKVTKAEFEAQRAELGL